MKTLIQAFPSNISDAFQLLEASNAKKFNNIKNVVVCGMGGSGIGAKLVDSWVSKEFPLPVTFVQDYEIPGCVNENTLLIASSYSGNTEETIDCLKDAIRKGAQIYGVCSGGQLADICKANNIPVDLVPGGNPPRTALAYSVIHILNLFEKQSWISGEWRTEMLAAKDLLISQEEDIHQKGKELASFLKDKVGVFYGVTVLEPVLIRARQQFNENSKLLCWHHTIPEMNHNEIVGWGGGDERFAVVMFTIKNISERNARRVQITKDKIKKHHASLMELEAKGDSIIEQTLYLIHVIDWASLYLSTMNDVDPMEIEIIDYLKAELANL